MQRRYIRLSFEVQRLGIQAQKRIQLRRHAYQDLIRELIDEGIREAIRHGPTAGYPVVGVGVRCVGGEYDILFSTEEDFRIAADGIHNLIDL